MKFLCCSVFIATSFLLARPIHAQIPSSGSDSSRSAAFDRLDRTSRMLLSTLRCARGAALARERGAFGPLDSLGRRGQCLRKDGRTFGMFFTPDSSYSKALNVRVVDLANSMRYAGPVDTTAILAEARAGREAVEKGFSTYQRENRQFMPITVRTDGDSIEVWLVPLGVIMGPLSKAVGGERAFIYSPDGRTLAREIDAFKQYRAITIPDSGQVTVFSQEDNLPLVSELIVINAAHDLGREAQVITKAFSSVLPRSEPAFWLQLKRR